MKIFSFHLCKDLENGKSQSWRKSFNIMIKSCPQWAGFECLRLTHQSFERDYWPLYQARQVFAFVFLTTIHSKNMWQLVPNKLVIDFYIVEFRLLNVENIVCFFKKKCCFNCLHIWAAQLFLILLFPKKNNNNNPVSMQSLKSRL